jgi:hypothetical protein
MQADYKILLPGPKAFLVQLAQQVLFFFDKVSEQ